MMKLSQAAAVLKGTLAGPDVHFAAVSSDSRSIGQGDLFVALRGERFDGFEYAAAAIAQGAAAAMVNADSYRKHAAQLDAKLPLLVVEDTRLALGELAAYWRQQFALPLIGITGSNGKTTVKEMLAHILRQHAGDADADAVLATKGNLNNDIGMPMTLLKLRASHRYAVIEMGMNHPGEIDYLTRIAAPDVALVNNAASAHLAGLGTVEAVAEAKGEIFAGLRAGGVAIINADDDFAGLWRAKAAGHPVIDFGIEHAAAVHGQWQAQEFGARVQAATPQGKLDFELQVPGIHNVRNALAAAAAALAAGVPLAAIADALGTFSGVVGRLQRKTALHGAVMIDDTYNANPASLMAAIKVLAQARGKKILVLGDMGELGADAPRLHAEIGAEAHAMGIQKLLALGDLSTYAVDEFGPGATHFKRIEDLLACLEQNLDSDSTVLVKGSRFMKMERVVQHCTALQ